MTNWVERLTGETTSKLLSLLRRSRLTITALADALHLTDNAVRTHIAALERDGIVEHVGTQRETGGKPARVYALTGEGEELFPKAYALVLGGLVEEIARVDGWERATALLRAVGQRAALGAAAPADREVVSPSPPPRCAAWEETSRSSARSEGICCRGTPVRSRR